MRAAIILACIAGPVCAQPCAPRADAVDGLEKRFGEAQTYVGIGQNSVLEILANPATGTWSALVTTPDGMSCMIMSGQAFAIISAPKPGTVN